MPAAIAAAAQVASAGIQAGADIVNNSVTQLFQNKIYKAEADRIGLQGRLQGLDESQQFILALKLQQATSDNQKFAILKQAASEVDKEIVKSTGEIRQQGIKSRATESVVTAIIIGSAVILLIVAFNVIYKRK